MSSINNGRFRYIPACEIDLLKTVWIIKCLAISQLFIRKVNPRQSSQIVECFLCLSLLRCKQTSSLLAVASFSRPGLDNNSFLDFLTIIVDTHVWCISTYAMQILHIMFLDTTFSGGSYKKIFSITTISGPE